MFLSVAVRCIVCSPFRMKYRSSFDVASSVLRLFSVPLLKTSETSSAHDALAEIVISSLPIPVMRVDVSIEGYTIHFSMGTTVSLKLKERGSGS